MPKPTFSANPNDPYRLNRQRLAYQSFCFLMQLHCHIEPSEKGFIRHMHDSKGRLLVQWSHEEALIEYRCLMEMAWLSLPSTVVMHGLELPAAEEWEPIVSRCLFLQASIIFIGMEADHIVICFLGASYELKLGSIMLTMK